MLIDIKETDFEFAINNTNIDINTETNIDALIDISTLPIRYTDTDRPIYRCTEIDIETDFDTDIHTHIKTNLRSFLA